MSTIKYTSMRMSTYLKGPLGVTLKQMLNGITIDCMIIKRNPNKSHKVLKVASGLIVKGLFN